MLQESLARYKDIYQYVYSHVFPEVYTSSEKRGFDVKSNFHILFKSYRDKQMMRQCSLAKNQANSKNEQSKETPEHEHKPIKNFNEFCNSEEQEVKKKLKNDRLTDAKKQKNWRWKSEQKSEENKVKEGEMWNRLNELNSEDSRRKSQKRCLQLFYR